MNTDSSDTTTTVSDIIDTCFTCGPLQEYSDLAQGFADHLSSALTSPMWVMFGSLFALWAVLMGYRLAFKLADIQTFIKDFIYISITTVLLSSHASGLISWVYSACLEVMGGAAKAAFSVAQGQYNSEGYDGIVALAATGEKAVAKIWYVCGALVDAGGVSNLMNYIYALVLIIPYFLLVVSYASQVIIAIFRVMMISVFAPFLFMSFAFDWGRPMASSGVKTMIATITTLFACTSALALTVYGVNSLNLDTLKDTDAINALASISNPKFLVILFLGWIGTALMTEGTSIANSVTQSMLTNAAAGILTAGVAGSALAAGKTIAPSLNPFSGRGLSNVGKGATALAASPVGLATVVTGKAIGAAGSAALQGAGSLYDRYKNVNKPKGGGV